MRILIAPDKFKGSLGANEVARHIAIGMRAVLPEAEIECLPIADGGEGTAATIAQALGGETRECAAHDALGKKIRARYSWISESRTAIMDMSAAAGLQALAPNERNPLRTSTFGVGEMLRNAAAADAQEIILGLGGSATNDGGLGLARALGFRFWSDVSTEIISTPALQNLHRIEASDESLAPSIVAATDVRNPLLGPRGATRIFGPQKGATAADLETLEAALTRLADVAAETFGSDARETPGAGAAGGLGFGLITFCRAVVRPGFSVVAEAIRLEEKVARADFVVTGEGRLDHQSLEGKAPAGVAQLAHRHGKPVFAIVGQAAAHPEVHALFDHIASLDDTSANYRETRSLLEQRAQELAELLRDAQFRPSKS